MDGQNSDTILVQGFRAGNSVADSQVFKMYFRPMCLLAEKLTQDRAAAEDIVADTFIRLFHKRKEFDGLGNIQSFLYTCVRNASITYLTTNNRHRQVHTLLFRSQNHSYEDSSSTLQLEMIRAELLRKIYAEIEALPGKCRTICKQVFVQGKRTEEIAAEMGISPQTVRSQKSRGVRLLRLQLASEKLIQHLMGLVVLAHYF